MSARTKTSPTPVESPPLFAPQALEFLERNLELASGSRICDLGAGTGFFSLALMQQGWSVTAVESDERLRAVGMLRTRGKGEVVWRADGPRDLDWNRFHLVCYAGSFARFEPAQALREAQRLLEPGGHLAILWNEEVGESALEGELGAILAHHGIESQPSLEPWDQVALSERFETLQHVQLPHQRQVTQEAYLEELRNHVRQLQAGREPGPELMQALEMCLQAFPEETLTQTYATHLCVAPRL